MDNVINVVVTVLNPLTWIAIIVDIIRSAKYVIILVAVIGIVVATRSMWWPKLKAATCGQMHCADMRDGHCCCFSWGWCIMNVLFPFVCPKFHPPFQLRLIIVKAKSLKPANVGQITQGYMSVYVDVQAGNNPVKSTSVKHYNFSSAVFAAKASDESVWWNEPIDLVIQPSVSSITVQVRTQTAFGAEVTGSVILPVEEFYEPPGPCFECLACGYYPCPKLLGANKYPFTRGAPRDIHFGGRQLEEGDQALSGKFCCDVLQPEQQRIGIRKGKLFKNDPDKQRVVEEVQEDGMKLKDVDSRWRDDKDVVMAAVGNNSEAIKYASPEKQADLQVRRIAANAPEPMILQLESDGEPAGRLWAYFVMHNGDLPALPTLTSQR